MAKVKEGFAKPSMPNWDVHDGVVTYNGMVSREEYAVILQAMQNRKLQLIREPHPGGVKVRWGLITYTSYIGQECQHV